MEKINNKKLLFYILTVFLAWSLVTIAGAVFQPDIGLDWLVMYLGFEVDHFWCRVISLILAVIVINGFGSLIGRVTKSKRHSLPIIFLVTGSATVFADQIDFAGYAEASGYSAPIIAAMTIIGFLLTMGETIIGGVMASKEK